MDANVAVMVPTPDVKVVVSLDQAMQVVAPAAAPPWAFVKHRWTVQVFPAESVTEERSPSLPSTAAVLSPANHKTAIFLASRFSVATVQVRLVPAVLLWAVHVAPPVPKAACAREAVKRSKDPESGERISFRFSIYSIFSRLWILKRQDIALQYSF